MNLTGPTPKLFVVAPSHSTRDCAASGVGEVRMSKLLSALHQNPKVVGRKGRQLGDRKSLAEKLGQIVKDITQSVRCVRCVKLHGEGVILLRPSSTLKTESLDLIEKGGSRSVKREDAIDEDAEYLSSCYGVVFNRFAKDPLVCSSKGSAFCHEVRGRVSYVLFELKDRPIEAIDLRDDVVVLPRDCRSARGIGGISGFFDLQIQATDGRPSNPQCNQACDQGLILFKKAVCDRQAANFAVRDPKTKRVPDHRRVERKDSKTDPTKVPHGEFGRYDVSALAGIMNDTVFSNGRVSMEVTAAIETFNSPRRPWSEVGVFGKLATKRTAYVCVGGISWSIFSVFPNSPALKHPPSQMPIAFAICKSSVIAVIAISRSAAAGLFWIPKERSRKPSGVTTLDTPTVGVGSARASIAASRSVT